MEGGAGSGWRSMCGSWQTCNRIAVTEKMARTDSNGVWRWQDRGLECLASGKIEVGKDLVWASGRLAAMSVCGCVVLLIHMVTDILKLPLPSLVCEHPTLLRRQFRSRFRMLDLFKLSLPQQQLVLQTG
jgi:hypothetical protein